MGCWRNRRSGNTNPTYFRANNTQENQPVSYTKPILTITIPIEKIKKVNILIFVNDPRYCSAPDHYVDYVINWLIEDGYRYEKYHVRSSQGLKYKIQKTPTIIIEYEQKKHQVHWVGVSLTYKTIIEAISKL